MFTQKNMIQLKNNNHNNNKIMKFTGNWIEQEKKIILSEFTQTQKDIYGI